MAEGLNFLKRHRFSSIFLIKEPIACKKGLRPEKEDVSKP